MAQLIKKVNGYGIRFYTEINGSKERKYLYQKGWNKEDAYKAMLEYKKNIESVIDDNILYKDFLGKFFTDYVQHNVTYSTQKRYAELIKLHIIPALGNVKLNMLKPAQIQSFYSEKLNQYQPPKTKNKNKTNSTKKYSPSTVRRIHSLITLSLKHAQLWGYTNINPALAVKPPSNSKKTMKILTDEQVSKLLKYVRNEDYYIVFYIATTTGMRLGEVCGLQISCVDTDKELFNIKHSLKIKEGKWILGFTKTDGSKRPVSFLSEQKEVLKHYLKTRAKYNLINNNYFCVWSDGKPFTVDYISKKFMKIIRELNYDTDLTFHSLRHTHASWLLKNGVHPKIVAERLGHSSVKITLDTYSHLIPNLQTDVIKSLDAKLF